MKDQRDTAASRYRRATQIARTGNDPAEFFGFVNPPVVHASTVLFPDVETSFAGTQRYTYGRRGSPGVDALCNVMNALEGSESTILVPTGLVACTVPLAAVTKAGDRVLIVDNAYAPTRKFCDGFLTRFGVEVVYFDPLDVETYARLLKSPTAAVFLEAPGSLTFEVPDVPLLAGMAKEVGATVMLDNTWATPLYFRPLDHGCDISMHAATKYIAGHSDLLLGTISANGEAAEKVKKTWDEWGEHVGPDDVYLTYRGVKTLDVRLERHQRNARIVAEWLAADPRVHRVLYPALPGAPGHEIWKRDFSGATGLFAITLKGDRESAARVVDTLDLFGIGFSWGGFESLATLPMVQRVRTATTWPEDEQLIRLHIGLEDPQDLIEDLDRGLAAFAG
ncbi:cystathionine beta-lyase [Acuticoccus kandeliae]|uniref:cystathionine beta-lyase n=1 Tax=Acuticoccus kandeliae TaxID=2073160 RepID=UPI000D3E62F2|nr:cystathionine beta-lyase [Acuticoccus kandeliae]